MSLSSNKIARSCAILLALFTASMAGRLAYALDGPLLSAGTVISNRAEAIYKDDAGASFAALSPTVTVTVLAVSALAVTPDETESSASTAPNERLTRLFQICNTGNTPDLYTITRAGVSAPARLLSLHFDMDASSTLTDGDALIRVGATMSPRLAPGACISVIAEIESGDAAPGSRLSIGITARSNVAQSANGLAQDDGAIINAVGNGARLSDPTNPNLPPVKLIEGRERATATAGQTITYTISFRNSGDVSARRVMLLDELPAGLEYVAGSLRLGERSLTDADDVDEGQTRGGRIEVRLNQIAPDELVQISFHARVSGQIAPGTGVINMATLSGENFSAVKSTAAIAILDPFGTVYAGRSSSGSAAVNGASVTILQDQSGTRALALAPDAGFAPNERNENPFVTATGGHFNFTLAPEQFGTQSAPSRYFINVTAAGYRTRLIEITTSAIGAGLFNATVRALDGQPLARSASFELTNDPVALENLASLALNLPVFEQHGLEITKSVDRPRAVIGDTISYRLELHNPTAAIVREALIRDRLPDSFHYVAGTARIHLGSSAESAIEPEMTGGEMIFRIGELAPGATARVLYRVRVGANAREGEQQNTAIASGTFSSGERDETAPARASVFIGNGVFSTRQIILGRVFIDTNRNGQFDANDKPVPNVRLFLNSGQSVITDSEGLYNFPSLGDGAQVIALDSLTLPEGFALSDGGSVAGRSWTRLLRTPLGGGAMLRQNFALVANNDSHSASSGGSSLAAGGGNSNRATQSADTTEHASVAQNAGANTTASTSVATQASRAAATDTAVMTPDASGIYEVASTETIEAMPAGAVRILSPAANAVVMAAAMQLEARVALDWTVKLEVNNEQISDNNIGTSRLDQKNKVATFDFVGINLRPGPNQVRVTAVNSAGIVGQSQEITVMGRGPVRRLEIVSEKREVQAGGRDSVTLRVRAFDQWGSPAVDGQVGIETSAGELFRLNSEASGARSSHTSDETQTTNAGEATEANESRTDLVVSLESGEAALRFVAPGAPGEARLHALMGSAEAHAELRITPELRPTILVGLAEVTVGKSVPEINLRGEEGTSRSRFSFFYNGQVWGDNILTLAYNSQRPLNRTAGRDRLFQLDPLDRVYPVFGDSSTRYEAAQSNSKLYARLDHKRSYAMFGDFEADMEDLSLAGYTRKLTGVKFHLENAEGDFISVTGARPDTAFARDVFAGGGLSLVRLSRADILPGSESVVLEVRDRRNPETILSRETLSRSVDYNLNPATGELFFLRYISTYDYALNLIQVVVTYEHRAQDMSSAVYTARASKNFKSIGLRLGFSAVAQRESDFGSFTLGGIDGVKNLPHGGTLNFAWARSNGRIMGAGSSGGSFFETGAVEHNGDAYRIEIVQPFNFYGAALRARYASASEGFMNPFGATVTPGSRRGEISMEFKPRPTTLLHFGVTTESNRTTNVDNKRLTFSAGWEQVINERVRFHVGYDRRSLSDDLTDRTTESNLVTVGAEMQLTDKLQVSVKREQNFGAQDPTYPNQTTLAATYQLTQLSRLFFTQRLASAPIVPIGDVAQTGFAATGARRETAIGIETRFGKYTSMTGRYQLENGINGTDSFAVVGLQNRLPLNKNFALELGFERGFHVAGQSASFNSATIGLGWQPNENFRTSARYEFRDRGGIGQLFVLGAAGRLGDGVTALARFQMSRAGFDGRTSSSMDGVASLAIRPLKSDRAGLLFSYNHRSIAQASGTAIGQTRDRIDSLSTDGYFQATRDLELYGRFALRFNANGQADLPFVSTLTYMTQARAQYRLSQRFDWAGEARVLMQPSSGSQRTSIGTELGFWAIPDLRVGVGYNFNLTGEPEGAVTAPARRGFYFTISSKLSRIFDLFGTPRAGLADSENTAAENSERR